MAGMVCTLHALAGSEACREYESARLAYVPWPVPPVLIFHLARFDLDIAE
jgi:hypothetical protein